MKLVSLLASGIRGAENGAVDIFVRGTPGTRAQIFTDFDGGGAQTPTGPIQLDAYGGATVYVNQPIECTAYAVNGAAVRPFVDMSAATEVEVISQSFTGRNYDSGAAGAGQPTLLSTVLDLWKASAGTTDFKVLVSGASATLQGAFAPIVGIYVNVKDPAYGAIGNGVADDTTAINAAIAAANATGSQVLFPAGTYKVTSPLSAFNGAGGCIALNAVLAFQNAASPVVTISGGVNGQFYMNGLSFSRVGNNSRYIDITGTVSVTLFNVTCVGGTVSFGTITSTGRMILIASNIQTQGPIVASGGDIMALGTVLDGVDLANGLITHANAASTIIAAGCIFSRGLTNSSYIFAAAGQRIVSIGNSFGNPSAGSCRAYAANPPGAGNGVLFEAANGYGSAVDLATFFSPGIPAADASGDFTSILGRTGRRSYQVNDTVNATFLTDNFAICHLRRTAAGAQSILLVSGISFWPNAETQVILENDSGVGITFTFSNTIIPAGGVVVVAAARVRILMMRTLVVAGVLYYIVTSDSGDLAGI